MVEIPTWSVTRRHARIASSDYNVIRATGGRGSSTATVHGPERCSIEV